MSDEPDFVENSQYASKVFVVVSIQDSLGAYCNASQEVDVRYQKLNLQTQQEQLLLMKQNGDFVSEARLINVLSHYLWNDTESLELKKFVLDESKLLRDKLSSSLLKEQLQKSIMLIQTSKELTQNLNVSEVSSAMDDAMSFLQKSMNLSEKADSQIEKDSLKNNLIRCMGSLDGALLANSENFAKRRRRRLLEGDEEQDDVKKNKYI